MTQLKTDKPEDPAYISFEIPGKVKIDAKGMPAWIVTGLIAALTTQLFLLPLYQQWLNSEKNNPQERTTETLPKPLERRP